VKRGGDVQEAELREGKTPGMPGWGEDPNPLLLFTEKEAPTELRVPMGSWGAYYVAVRDAVTTGVEPPVTPAQATTVIAVIEAGLRSAAEGRVVRPDYADAERAAW
jgi:predicted dehydrogenase